MTRLTTATLASARPGTHLPAYDRATVTPGIVHIGLGGFHRAHQALYLDDLIASDPAARSFGLVGVNLLPTDARMAQVMAEQDGLYTVLERHPDGTTTARVVGSILTALFAPGDRAGVLAALEAPGTRIVSLTITEGGYCYDAATRAVDLDNPGLRHDLQHPDEPTTAFGYLAAGLRRRRAAGTGPFTVMSCDNVHGNGDITRRVLTAFAGAQDPELGSWVAEQVAFPNSMVDRITPRTTEADVEEAADRTGLDDAWPVSCEPFRQWVLEDQFSAGRPAWEQAGVQLVPDVAPYELMKMRLLNAGHQSIAYAGRLLGHQLAWQATQDESVRALLTRYQQREAVHTLPEVPGVDLPGYATTVVERFANPQIGDSLDRLAGQSSTMMATFVLPVCRDLIAADRDARATIAIIACWARYLEGIDEAGGPVPIVDVQADDLTTRAARHGEDLLALVRGNALFAGLADDPRFTGPYAATLAKIRTQGTRSALTEVLAAPG
jgi:mannitol 2-dehydrogenase